MNLRFLETAKAEFWEAAAYYEHERQGLGGEFAREISNFRPPDLGGVFSEIDEIRMSRKMVARVAGGW